MSANRKEPAQRAVYRISVECYAGYRADESPLRFAMGAPGKPVRAVEELIDQWYGEDFRCFKVRADDGNLYILRHSEKDDIWTLDSYRRGPV